MPRAANATNANSRPADGAHCSDRAGHALVPDPPRRRCSPTAPKNPATRAERRRRERWVERLEVMLAVALFAGAFALGNGILSGSGGKNADAKSSSAHGAQPSSATKPKPKTKPTATGAPSTGAPATSSEPSTQGAPTRGAPPSVTQPPASSPPPSEEPTSPPSLSPETSSPGDVVAGNVASRHHVAWSRPRPPLRSDDYGDRSSDRVAPGRPSRWISSDTRSTRSTYSNEWL